MTKKKSHLKNEKEERLQYMMIIFYHFFNGIFHFLN